MTKKPKKRSASGRRHSIARAKRLGLSRTGGSSEVERGPEKAGADGSIPSLPTIPAAPAEATLSDRVKALLNESDSAHRQAIGFGLHQLRRYWGMRAEIRQCIDRAILRRMQAHDLDPNHTAEQWENEKVTHRSPDIHRELVRFFEVTLRRIG